jgi:hypothetical protein
MAYDEYLIKNITHFEDISATTETSTDGNALHYHHGSHNEPQGS